MARARWLLLLTATVALVSCSSLPEYAAPKGGVVDPARLDLTDVISYRSLVRDDFKAEQPPPELGSYVDRIGAATCGHILAAPDTQLMVQPVRSPAEGMVYRASPHRLRFRAQMHRKCSWWNPKDIGLPKDYILEHEQIHFAIFELEARRLNASLPEIEARLTATATSPEAAAQIIQQRLQGELESVLKSVLAHSRQFDEDTSMGHQPERQKRWWDRVHSDLARTDQATSVANDTP